MSENKGNEPNEVNTPASEQAESTTEPETQAEPLTNPNKGLFEFKFKQTAGFINPGEVPKDYLGDLIRVKKDWDQLGEQEKKQVRDQEEAKINNPFTIPECKEKIDFGQFSTGVKPIPANLQEPSNSATNFGSSRRPDDLFSSDFGSKRTKSGESGFGSRSGPFGGHGFGSRRNKRQSRSNHYPKTTFKSDKSKKPIEIDLKSIPATQKVNDAIDDQLAQIVQDNFSSASKEEQDTLKDLISYFVIAQSNSLAESYLQENGLPLKSSSQEMANEKTKSTNNTKESTGNDILLPEYPPHVFSMMTGLGMPCYQYPMYPPQYYMYQQPYTMYQYPMMQCPANCH